MLPTVPVQPIRLEDYRGPAGDEAVERLRAVAEPLRGARVLHLNSTAFGGGVAELLFTHVPLLQDLGIDGTWQVLEGSDDFFAVTKFVHNGLQGAEVPWTEEMQRIYLDRVRANAAEIADDLVAGDVGGIKLQIEDGVSGYLVDSVDECAERVTKLLADDDLRTRIGRAGRDRVRDRFLSLRQLEDYLRLLRSL